MREAHGQHGETEQSQLKLTEQSAAPDAILNFVNCLIMSIFQLFHGCIHFAACQNVLAVYIILCAQ